MDSKNIAKEKEVITWEEWKDKPVPPYGKEYSSESRFTGLEGEQQDWEYWNGFLDNFAYELQEAKANDIGLRNWQEWYSLEFFFGQRLSYEDFCDLQQYYNEDETVDGSILELQGPDPWIEAFRKGDKVWFTNHSDNQNSEKEKATILRLLTSEEADLFDVGPMYKVQLANTNGDIRDAFYSELSR